MPVGAQLAQQFQPCHTRQIGVDQQARVLDGTKSLQKRLAARIRLDDTAAVLQNDAYCAPNLVVIVDNENFGLSRDRLDFEGTCGERRQRLRQQLLDRLCQLPQLDGLVELNAIMAGDVAQGFCRDVAGENDEGNVQVEPLPHSLRNLDARQPDLGLVELNAIMAGDVAQGFCRDVAGENDEGNVQVEPLPHSLRNLDARQP